MYVAISTCLGGTSPPAVTRTGPSAVLGVGAAAGVGVVVGEVRADLDEDRAEQRGDERARPEDVGELVRERGADEHGRDRRGQRARARGHEPDAHVAAPHGRFGKREKSGLRLAL